MSASGEAIFSLASAAGCARFYKLVLAYECTGGRYAALRCVISSASQRRSCLRAVNRTHSHAWSAGLRNTISGMIVPLYWQDSSVTKHRSLRTGEAACVSTHAGRRGALSSASDGHMVETTTQDDLLGLAGTPLDRGRRHGFGLSKQVLLHRFGGADEVADCLSTAKDRHRGLRTLRDDAFHRCAPADETAASPAQL